MLAMIMLVIFFMIMFWCSSFCCGTWHAFCQVACTAVKPPPPTPCRALLF